MWTSTFHVSFQTLDFVFYKPSVLVFLASSGHHVPLKFSLQDTWSHTVLKKCVTPYMHRMYHQVALWPTIHNSTYLKAAWAMTRHPVRPSRQTRGDNSTQARWRYQTAQGLGRCCDPPQRWTRWVCPPLRTISMQQSGYCVNAAVPFFNKLSRLCLKKEVSPWKTVSFSQKRTLLIFYAAVPFFNKFSRLCLEKEVSPWKTVSFSPKRTLLIFYGDVYATVQPLMEGHPDEWLPLFKDHFLWNLSFIFPCKWTPYHNPLLTSLVLKLKSLCIPQVNIVPQGG